LVRRLRGLWFDILMLKQIGNRKRHPDQGGAFCFQAICRSLVPA
jgi:hypothetical protein